VTAQFLWGALSLACFLVALLFLRSWRDVRDRFFLLFSLAFAALGLNWVLVAAAVAGEHQHYVYLVRLAAFLLSIAAIIDRNRGRPPG
jgi:hypothetical protein